MVLNLAVYVSICPSFKSQKPSENPIFRTFLAKNSILAYFSLKITKLGKISNYDVIVTSYHTQDFVLF